MHLASARAHRRPPFGRTAAACSLVPSLLLLPSCSGRHISSAEPSEPQVAASKAPDGVRIAYSVAGHGQPTLVFIHGWACDQTFWTEQVLHFARTMTVVTLDLAGHGASERTRQAWTIRNFASDVATVVRAVGARQVVLIGHSLGGPVAVEAALLLPQQTVAVVGIDTFFDVWPTQTFSDVISQLKADFGPSLNRFVRGIMFTPRSDSALVSRVAAAMANGSPEILLPALVELQVWARDRMAAALSNVQVPLGVIQASAAGHSLLEHHRTELPALERDTMPANGHFMMLEDPIEFNARLDSLLKRLRVRAAA